MEFTMVKWRQSEKSKVFRITVLGAVSSGNNLFFQDKYPASLVTQRLQSLYTYETYSLHGRRPTFAGRGSIARLVASLTVGEFGFLLS